LTRNPAAAGIALREPYAPTRIVRETPSNADPSRYLEGREPA